MAASIAILIYLEIPRVAFERQRDKEALLIDRGEQYARAIELYTRKTRSYPQTLDQLDQGQPVRFLRRRYKDPMTGKDEWRLIHINNGIYVDSKVHKASTGLENQDNGPSVLASKIQGVGQSASVISQDGQGLSPALQKRGSDRISPGSVAGGGSGDQNQNGSPDASQDPNQALNNAGQTSGTANSAQFPFPGQQGSGSQQPNNSQNGATPAFGSASPSTQQGAAGNNSSNSGSSAAQAIQSILGGQRTSSTGGGGTTTGQAGVGGVGGGGLGSGIAGVATTVELEGIRIYKDHSNYSEWEFIFDPKDTNGQGQGVGAQQAGNGTNGAPGAPGASFGGMPGGTPAPATSTPQN